MTSKFLADIEEMRRLLRKINCASILNYVTECLGLTRKAVHFYVVDRQEWHSKCDFSLQLMRPIGVKDEESDIRPCQPGTYSNERCLVRNSLNRLMEVLECFRDQAPEKITCKCSLDLAVGYMDAVRIEYFHFDLDALRQHQCFMSLGYKRLKLSSTYLIVLFLLSSKSSKCSEKQVRIGISP